MKILIYDQAESFGGSIARVFDLLEIQGKHEFICVFRDRYLDDKYNRNRNILIKKLYSFSNYTMKIHRVKRLRQFFLKGIFPDVLIVKSVLFLDFLNDQFVKFQISSIIRSESIDVVIMNSNFDKNVFDSAKKNDIKKVCYFRSFDFFGKDLEFSIPDIDQVIFVSEPLKNEYEKTFSFLTDRTCVLPSPFEFKSKPSEFKNLSKFGFEQPLAFLHIGRVCEQKGQLDALKALKELIDAGYDCHITFCGGLDPDMESKKYFVLLKNFISSQNLSGFVSFLGHTKDVQALYIGHHIFLHTATRFESLGGAVIEAMHGKVIVIASDIGGPASYIEHGINGYLYNAGNVNQLVELIKQIVKDKKCLSKVREAAFAKSLEFSADRIRPQFFDIIERLDQGL
jgi:glycosyltransferase involved in cell wall biosynthesis